MLSKIIKLADLTLAKLQPPLKDKDAPLLIFAFHAVLERLDELDADAIDPYQPILLSDLETLVGTLRAQGYRFVTGRALAAGQGGGRCAWLTFDDGYANNLRLLPLLDRLDVPATIFVSSGHVERGDGYWWDTLWRLRRADGAEPAAIAAEREALKALPPEEIAARMRATFGDRLDAPLPDLARPMTESELARAARHPLIEIGNHTHDHAILPVLAPDAQRAQIARCQDSLTRITGEAPVSIAYPNGDATPDTLRAAKAAGLTVGVTCTPVRERSDAATPNRLALGRFAALRHGRLGRELALARAPVSVTRVLSRRVQARLVS